jgi:hypothetical protein
VVTSQRIIGRFRHIGIPLDTPWGSIISVANGKIVRARGLGSAGQAFKAAGLPR